MSPSFFPIWKDCLQRFRGNSFRPSCVGCSNSPKGDVEGLKFKRTNTELLRGIRHYNQQISTHMDNNNDSKCSGPGQFRATQLWNEIIAYLRTEVQVKRRRLKMFQYDQCFTGSDAVDVVLTRLQAERLNFTRDVSRDKAVKLCQLLMEHHVFESLSNSSSDHFDDSRSKLYRFLEDEKENQDESSCSDCDLSTKEDNMRIQRDLEAEHSSYDVSYNNTPVMNKHGQIVQELMDITGAWKRYSSECLRKLTPAKLFTRRSSLPGAPESAVSSSKRGRSKKAIPPAVEDEVWREAVLSRLLQMVDLPMLDNILSYDPHRQERPLKKDMAFSNLAFRRQESFSSQDKRNDDLWMEAAIDSLECLPQGLDVLDGSLTEDTSTTQKLRLYQSLVDHYRRVPGPLWSAQFQDLHVELFNLLMQGKRSAVLRALQLSIVLLPRQLREEMKRLLIFMKLAAEESAVRLSAQESNRSTVEHSLAESIIRNKTLAPRQTGQLVLFMMDHVDEIFSMPEAVEEDIDMQLDQIVSGNSMPMYASGFCMRVSAREFTEQKLEGTERALVELMNNILDDTSISLKEKKQRFKQFQKHHPDVYKKHFSEIH